MDKHLKRGAALLGAGLLCGLGTLAFTLVARAHQGPPQKDMTIDAAARGQVIAAVIANLDKSYVFPQQAAAMDARLRAGLARGEFDSMTSADGFAQRLTDTLREVSHDGHLEVRYFEQELPPQAPGQQPSPREQAQELIEQRHFNYGFSSVGRLKGDLGYMDMHQFGRMPGAGERIAAAIVQEVEIADLSVGLDQLVAVVIPEVQDRRSAF